SYWLSSTYLCLFLFIHRPHYHSRLFFYNYPSPPEIYTLSLHDALPISSHRKGFLAALLELAVGAVALVTIGVTGFDGKLLVLGGDRKSTRLNSSHVSISYAVFCLKKKITWRPCFYIRHKMLRQAKHTTN